jgi:hypothetical protein
MIWHMGILRRFLPPPAVTTLNPNNIQHVHASSKGQHSVPTPTAGFCRKITPRPTQHSPTRKSVSRGSRNNNPDATHQNRGAVVGAFAFRLFTESEISIFVTGASSFISIVCLCRSETPLLHFFVLRSIGLKQNYFCRLTRIWTSVLTLSFNRVGLSGRGLVEILFRRESQTWKGKKLRQGILCPCQPRQSLIWRPG